MFVPRHRVKWEPARLGNQERCVIVPVYGKWLAGDRVSLLGDGQGPGHAAHCEKEVLLDNGHALAGSAAETKLGEAREVGVGCERFAVGLGEGGEEEAGGVEGFGVWVSGFVAGYGPGWC